MIPSATKRRRARKPPTAVAAVEQAVRVAIYTRKSGDKGEDVVFGSIDSQRERVEAYVTSQAGQGWIAVPTRYDDLGFSGATTSRPAFRRLLADIEAGHIDAVAVYQPVLKVPGSRLREPRQFTV